MVVVVDYRPAMGANDPLLSYLGSWCGGHLSRFTVQASVEEMNRRSFLGLLAAAAVGSTASYFLPPIGGWKSDVIFNPNDGAWDHGQMSLDALNKTIRVLIERDARRLSSMPSLRSFYQKAGLGGRYLGVTAQS